MTSHLHYASAALLLFLVLPASADDQQKLQKQMNKMTAMATDPVGRRIVNMTLADELKVERNTLVLERRYMNLNYGSIFVVHALTFAGARMDYIGSQLRSGKTVFQLGNELNADWKKITAQAKKVNRKVEENLYRHFVNSKVDLARDDAEHYQLRLDGVPPDNDVTEAELTEAENIYAFWQTQAARTSGRDWRLDTQTEHAARRDNVRDSTPKRGMAGGVAPAAGGIPND
jgi:hypothetical protein